MQQPQGEINDIAIVMVVIAAPEFEDGRRSSSAGGYFWKSIEYRYGVRRKRGGPATRSPALPSQVFAEANAARESLVS